MNSWTPAAVAGILTAAAGLVGAITALIVALRAHGRISVMQGQQSAAATDPAQKPGP